MYCIINSVDLQVNLKFYICKLNNFDIQTSLKMATLGDQNMYEAMLLIIQ